jgi:hypothetical protein
MHMQNSTVHKATVLTISEPTRTLGFSATNYALVKSCLPHLAPVGVRLRGSLYRHRGELPFCLGVPTKPISSLHRRVSHQQVLSALRPWHIYCLLSFELNSQPRSNVFLHTSASADDVVSIFSCTLMLAWKESEEDDGRLQRSVKGFYKTGWKSATVMTLLNCG